MFKLLTILFTLISFVFSQDIRVGSENSYKPFAYLDSDNNPSGFDNEVVKVVASYIQESKLNISSVSWNSLFSGLDSGKFDMIANQIVKNPKREEKYIFSTQPYFYGLSALIVKKDSKVDTLEQLKGKKIGVSVGSNHASNLETYLEKNPQLNIKINYYKTTPSLMSDLFLGRVNAIINDPVAVLEYAKAQNIDVKITDFVFEKTPVFFVFRKNSQELAKIIDQALAKAIADGKISQLSIRYFGIDLTK
ncbi:transporter substrate-binding domain-containing protein [Campylobacter jejuni]|nr:L-cystine-binding protein tcyA [Campylobacter jejuni]EHN6903022.1 transporter substrate-binding domain-containing protein [Campylobacter jejuni]EHN6916889.1 transporter substrate-binding domain-containing protein [Campylobacter jejuni]